MAKLSRREQEELLQRDEVAETITHWLQWYESHRRQVLIAAVCLAAVLIVVLILQSRRETAKSETNTQLNLALSQIGRLLSMTDTNARAEAGKTALQTLDAIIDNHGKTSLGNEARFLRGNVYFNLDQFGNAQKDYSEYLIRARGDEAQARGEIALAYAFENESFVTTDTLQQQTKLETSRQHYLKAMRLTPEGSYLHAYAHLGEARYHELTGDNAGAIQIYEEVMRNRPAPIPPASTDNKVANSAENEIEKLRAELNKNMRNLSFETAARLRLERLRAQASSFS